MFWIITKLSNTYSSSVEFEINFVDIPPLVVLEQDVVSKMKVDITASGFQLLVYHFFKDDINVSIENADYGGNLAEIDLMDQKFSLQKQLYQNAILNRVSPPQLNFSFGKLKRLKIPVIPPDEINFKPGYDQAGEWVIEPDSVWVYGTSKKVNALNGLSIQPLSQETVDNNIEEKVKLLPIDQIRFETESVLIKTSVKRFTEKSIDAFINIKNLPDSLSIKLFPQSLKVTFLVLVDKAESISAADFKFSCDYGQAQSKDENSLEVFMEMKPEGVSKVRWKPKKVDYLIRK
ncbi:MAG: hypothetical protein P8O98_07240 [Flavobacteriaceae bacterium]|nr:hypothetical protein [Flavobacteriaceae bacterium]MDG1941231.1 hypothetical protein [Flavobacteriaceae bacterium]